MKKLTILITILFVFSCNTSKYIWYRKGITLSECESDWTSLRYDKCFYNNECMQRKGYKLYHINDLPNDIEIKIITEKNHPFKETGLFTSKYWYGMAGDKIGTKYKLKERQKYVELHPHLSNSIKKAIFEGYFYPGMSLEECQIAMNSKGYVWEHFFTDSNGYSVWHCGHKYYRHILRDFEFDVRYSLTFIDNKLYHWTLW